SLRYVNTHLLAQDNSEAALLGALREGRAFVAFDLLADTRGFVFFADADGRRATMGEEVAFTPGLRLKGEAPLSARWTVLRDGEVVATLEGRSLDWPVPGAGNYRVELAIKPGAEWLDWIYANPVRITPST
ncbi:MAG: histidinol phosphatase, partial [Betaproteobacteria bacterium]|nr:histidinol phosphatase [Betaproteobacteria bacterium]